MPLTTIIIIHRFQGRLPACLKAIHAFTEREYCSVIINATGSRDLFERESMPANGKAPVRIVDADGAEDTVKACNTVLKQDGWHRVVIMNSTVQVAEGWLSALGACLDIDPQAGLAGPLMDAHYFGLPRQACNPTTLAGSYDDLNAALRDRHNGQRIAVRNPGVDCLAGRMATVRALGCLDETCEDIDVALADLCLRAEMAGYQNFLAGDIFVAGDNQSSSQRWQKALRDRWESLDPESEQRKHYEALTLCHRANQAHLREESDEAVELFLKGIGLYPGEPKLYLDLATLLAEVGQYADALQALEEMPVESRAMERRQLVGICQRGLGKATEADQTVDQLLADDNRKAAGWWLKAACLADRGAVDQARVALQESISCDSGYGPGYSLLGKLSEEAGEGEKVLDLLERGFALSPTEAVAAYYHNASSHRQAYRRAIPFFAQALAVRPSSRRLHYLLIDLLLKTGQHGAAMDVIESMLAAFGVEEGLINAALAVRAQLGPRVIAAAGSETATLALCLIVKDEERDLPRCLESIKPVADEIVVVDTGSRDRTRDVAQVFGARVFDFEWCDDFADARNFAVENASSDWIFSLDADEVLSPLDHGALKELLKTPSTKPVAYSLTTRNYLNVMDVVGWEPNDGFYPEEKGLGWIPSEKVRFFPNNHRVHFEYPVHEMVEPSLEKAGIPVRSCNIPVHHFGKLDHARSQAKGKTYFEIGIKKLEAMQNSVTGIRELAVQAQTLGNYKDAVRLWERLLQLEPGQAHTCINLGTAYLELGNYRQALKMARKAHTLDPSLKESHLNLGISLLYSGDANGAAAVLEKLSNRFSDYPSAIFMFSVASCCSGNMGKSLATLKKLRRSSFGPGLPEAFRSLAGGLKKAGQKTYARGIENLISILINGEI